ncbi:MAG: PBP1A family penicillin-binding protein [Acidobacteria bacterium]|nr:MAG: PBP1A family penicillin-binding protein [Acidobacteriota bacterium]
MEPDSNPPRRSRWKLWTAASILLFAAGSGLGLGHFLNLDLPSVKELADYRPPTITRLYDGDGGLLYQFAEQRRIIISFEQIPEQLRNAIVAVEDPRFYRHVGIDPTAIARAALKDILTLSKEQGASTITQQLARALFLEQKKRWRRKIQEAILAMEIERTYTKDEILTFYVNQIYLGHGRYGFEAASFYYFGKPARELELAEAALLAGLAQRPEGRSPLRDPEGAVRRRNHVLARMVIEGFLDQASRDAARVEPLVLRSPPPRSNPAPYFIEEVRRTLEKRYGNVALYQDGLEVRTTLDRELQALANKAVANGLRALDKRMGWRGPRANLLEDPTLTLASVSFPEWEKPLEVGSVVPALVENAEAGWAQIRVAEHQAFLGPKEIAWTKEKDPAAILRRGDHILVQVVQLDSEGLKVTLEQEPSVQAALVAIEPATGEIKAMVGGYDFQRSQFNRATQALRQAGSAFKPFVYAAALYAGYSPADVLYDEPTLFYDRRIDKVYQPNNYERDYRGIVTLRRGLEESVNIVSVRLLNRVGYEPVIQLARRMGISSPLYPYPSLALGASEVSLLELTSAYGTFPNQGVRVEPHLLRSVTGHDGSLREKARPEVNEALRPDIAHVMTRLLEGTVQRGTGQRAKAAGRAVAGKTGTTDNYTDAWFVGFSPTLVVGVWVGFDQQATLGRHESGARAALPIWVDVMKPFLAGRSVEHFVRPARVDQVPIDRRTGLRAGLDTGCQDVIMETFLEGTAPTEFCSEAHHFQISLPYFLQRYPLSPRRRLQLTARDVEWLTARQSSRVEGWFGFKRLETSYLGVNYSIPLEVLQPTSPLADASRVPYDPRMVDGEDVFFQDAVKLPPPPEEELQEAAIAMRPDPYRRWGVDGLDAVVIRVNN